MSSEDQSGGGNIPRGLIGRRGTPAGKGARLPSIRAPRDLTLGGVRKKTFTPNLAARTVSRDKNKDDAKTEAQTVKTTKVGKKERQDGNHI